MKRIPLFILILFYQSIFAHSATSQVVEYNAIISEITNPSIYGEVWAGQSITVGSPFLFDEWLSGDIFLVNGEISRGNPLKYDGLNDQLIWFNESINKSILICKSQIRGFDLYKGSDTLRFKKIYQDNISTLTGGLYVQVLYEGLIELLVNRRVEQTGVRQTNRNGKRLDLPILSSRDTYIIIDKDSKRYIYNRLSRSMLAKIFPCCKNMVKNTLHNRRVSNIDEPDLVLLFGMIEGDLINKTLAD